MDSDLDWISHGALQQLTGAHRTTVARWKRRAREGHLAAWLRRLVNTLWRGQLDELHPAWRGWLIHRRDGELVSPEGLCVTPGQVRALPYLHELHRALDAELRQLRSELARLEMRLQASAAPAHIPCGKSRRIRTEASRAGELGTELRRA